MADMAGTAVHYTLPRACVRKYAVHFINRQGLGPTLSSLERSAFVRSLPRRASCHAPGAAWSMRHHLPCCQTRERERIGTRATGTTLLPSWNRSSSVYRFVSLRRKRDLQENEWQLQLKRWPVTIFTAVHPRFRFLCCSLEEKKV